MDMAVYADKLKAILVKDRLTCYTSLCREVMILVKEYDTYMEAA